MQSFLGSNLGGPLGGFRFVIGVARFIIWLVVTGCHLDYFPRNIGNCSSSQMTNSYFFRGVFPQPPTSHPFLFGMFHEMDHPAIGIYPIFWDKPPEWVETICVVYCLAGYLRLALISLSSPHPVTVTSFHTLIFYSK